MADYFDLSYQDNYNPVIDAADDHNLASGLGTWFSGKIESLQNIPSFFAVSGLSAVNQFYNSGVGIANWFGAKAEERDTQEWITTFDDNLGQYYAENQQAADLAGFIGSSIIPGIAGVKALHYGQAALQAANAGKLGANFSAVTGILAPSKLKYLKLAEAQIRSSQITFSTLNANTLKALGSNVWQGVLEGVAAETFVQASLNASPILSQQDHWDITKNIALGGIFGGAFEGILGGVKTYSQLNKVIKDESAQRLPFTQRDIPLSATPPSEKILLLAENRDLSPIPLDSTSIDSRLYMGKRARINNQIREEIHNLNKGKSEADIHLGNYFADSIHDLDHVTVSANLAFSNSISSPLVASEFDGVAGYVSRFIDMDTGRVHSSLEGITLKNVDSGKKLPPINLKQAFSPLESAKFLQQLPDRFDAAKKINAVPRLLDAYDFPFLEKLYFSENKSWLGKTDIYHRGQRIPVSSFTKEDLFNFIKARKQEFITRLSSVEKLTPQQISVHANVSERFIEGVPVPDSFAYFGHLDRLEQLNLQRVSKGLSPIKDNVDNVPRYAKITYKIPDEDVNWALEAGVLAKEKQILYQDTINNVFTKYVSKEVRENTIELPPVVLETANQLGGGPGAFTFQNGGYKSLDAHMSYIAQSVTVPLKQNLRAQTRDMLLPALQKLQSNADASIEFSVINQKVSASPGIWTRTGNVLTNLETDATIFIKNEETLEAVIAHQKLTKKRDLMLNDIYFARGKVRDMPTQKDVFYPVKPDIKTSPYVAFVQDKSGAKTMLFASTNEDLAGLIAKVPTGYKVYTKTDAENFYRAAKEYDYQDTLRERFLDSSLRSKGVYSPFFPKTDPKAITDELLNLHLKGDDYSARELVKLKYEKEFTFLEDLGQDYISIDSAKVGAGLNASRGEKNPYHSYIESALDVQKSDDLKIFREANKLLDKGTAHLVKKVKELKTLSVEDLDAVNKSLRDAGYEGAYYDAATALYANTSLGGGELSKFIGRANALLAKFVLGLDPLNALNNVLGANILRTPEMRSALREIAPVGIPGTPSKIGSTAKLIAQAANDFWTDRTKQALRKFYTDLGAIKTLDDQFSSIIDDFTIQGKESAQALNSRMTSALAKGEKLSGNYHAEQFNRFVSARTAHLMGEKMGLNHEELRVFITTFVNRVEGAMLPSQRPSIFQGPIGKAVGLFQSYQFNLMQQLFRYIGEGQAKDAAMLLGLQGSIYGLQGMPAFDLINMHLVGTASGNVEHKDLYDGALTLAGKDGAEFLMYGAPSWFLGTNLYTRGDINPRHPTILPTDLEKVPLVSMTGKFFGSMYEGLNKSVNGGNPWEALLNSLEHNGINRPLAGLATVLQGHSTTSNGSIAFQNDLLSMSSLSRLVGGKPLDEAVATDAVFRIKAYEAKDREKLKKFKEAVKTHINSGSTPSDDDLTQLAKLYAAGGGKQSQFAKYMVEQYKTGDITEIEKFKAQLKTETVQKLQHWMDE